MLGSMLAVARRCSVRCSVLQILAHPVLPQILKLAVRGSKSTLIRLAVCRSPSPPSPMRKWMTAEVPGSAEGASHEGTWQTQIDLHDRPCRVHPRCGRLSLPGAPSLLGRDQPYSPSPPPRLSPPTSTHPLVSDCTVPCRYVVHSGYAYPSALLWADLL